jgi:hypothetical protein
MVTILSINYLPKYIFNTFLCEFLDGKCSVFSYK